MTVTVNGKEYEVSFSVWDVEGRPLPWCLLLSEEGGWFGEWLRAYEPSVDLDDICEQAGWSTGGLLRTKSQVDAYFAKRDTR